jgi:DNA-binding response OmpR family regulator
MTAHCILVVDDDRDAAESLAILLRLNGHTVETAFDGEEALRIAAVFHPRVALLDLAMPKLDGYQLARHLRESEWAGDLSLIAVTGWHRAEDKARAQAAGFHGYVHKPFEIDTLEELIDTVVSGDTCL